MWRRPCVTQAALDELTCSAPLALQGVLRGVLVHAPACDDRRAAFWSRNGHSGRRGAQARRQRQPCFVDFEKRAGWVGCISHIGSNVKEWQGLCSCDDGQVWPASRISVSCSMHRAGRLSAHTNIWTLCGGRRARGFAGNGRPGRSASPLSCMHTGGEGGRGSRPGRRGLYTKAGNGRSIHTVPLFRWYVSDRSSSQERLVMVRFGRSGKRAGGRPAEPPALPIVLVENPGEELAVGVDPSAVSRPTAASSEENTLTTAEREASKEHANSASNALRATSRPPPRPVIAPLAAALAVAGSPAASHPRCPSFPRRPPRFRRKLQGDRAQAAAPRIPVPPV